MIATSAPPFSEVTAAIDKARRTASHLGEVLDLYREIFRIQCLYRDSFEPRDLPGEWTPTEASPPPLAIPLPGMEDEPLRSLLADLGTVFAQHHPERVDQLQTLVDFTKEQSLPLPVVLATVVDDSAPTDLTRGCGLNRAALRSIMLLAGTPFYEKAASELLPKSTGEVWEHNTCPLCGQPPGASRLATETGQRLLACRLCRSEWSFPRMKCPFCGTTKPGDLSSLTAEDSPQHSVVVCEACRRYLKTVDERAAGKEVCVRVHEVLMFPLEMEAATRKYVA